MLNSRPRRPAVRVSANRMTADGAHRRHPDPASSSHPDGEKIGAPMASSRYCRLHASPKFIGEISEPVVQELVRLNRRQGLVERDRDDVDVINILP